MTPYVLTNAHCVPNGIGAGQSYSATVFFRATTDCGSVESYASNARHRRSYTVTVRAISLDANLATDFALIDLGGDVPGGVAFAGWDYSVTSENDFVGRIFENVNHANANSQQYIELEATEYELGGTTYGLRFSTKKGRSNSGASGSGNWNSVSRLESLHHAGARDGSTTTATSMRGVMLGEETVESAARFWLDPSGTGEVAIDHLEGPEPPPSVDFFSSAYEVTTGELFTLNWDSERADYCEADGQWSGTKPTSGLQAESHDAPGFYQYSLTCFHSTGSLNQTITIDVKAPATSGSGGGGALTLWSLLLAPMIAIRRQRRKV